MPEPVNRRRETPGENDAEFERIFVSKATLDESWVPSLYRNLRDALFPPKLPPLEIESRPLDASERRGAYGLMPAEDTSNRAPSEVIPVDVETDLAIENLEEPWLKSLARNLKELVNPPNLPPLELQSKPVAVKSIWGLYNRDNRSGVISLAVHGVVVLVVFAAATSPAIQQQVRESVSLIAPLDLAPYVPQAPPKAQTMGGGGGGGDNNPLPPSKGKLPRPALRQFTPPSATPPEDPKLPMEPTIIAPPDVQLPNVNMNVWGDPLAALGPPSSGPGSGGGIGTGSGGGVGPGQGGGFGPGRGGGVGGGVFRVGGGVTTPRILYKSGPEYSEEARKAKYSGTVVLYIEVDASGKPQNLRIVKGIGLGLDEKAIEAVQKWRFKPGLKDGKPVTVAAQIEVNFPLL